MGKIREQLTVKKQRAVLVYATHLGRSKSRMDNLAELTALAQTAGAVIVDRFQQRLRSIHPATYIGKGKVEMLSERVRQFEAEVVIFDNDLSPGQIRELEKMVGVKVVDRSELILDIFATRAKTAQAKLQVELAQLEYTYPRLTRMWGHLDTVAGAGGGTAAGAVGGIGTRGTGEKQLEIDRRLLSKRITELKRELAGIDKRRLREIKGREGSYKICIVGYTNAGKSTLMNALTEAGVFVEDRLFATLDTRTRKWHLEAGAEVLLSDTVGFVRDLPHHLVASFKATLEEAVNADLLLHVVDVSNEKCFEQIKSVEDVLEQIGAGHKEMIMLLNKSDVLRSGQTLGTAQTIYPDAICISARTGMNIDKIHGEVLKKYRGREVLVRVVCGAEQGKLQSFLKANARITSQEYSDNAVKTEAYIGRNQLAILKRLDYTELQIIE